ncbi:hypothetical protein ACFORO_33015 [Amycolatopsis halotolerans]|uniref:Flagellar hook-length control protein FliK n=1 Tax=Amycolatopsis halotolerans TaxID=330083 RepID=A0ABV7QTX1_9PSEU
MRRLIAALAAGFMAMGGIAAPAAVAAPACTATSGVLVVVDFGSLGGGVVQRCLGTPPESGYDALRAAGFRTAGTVHDGPAFVCRIDDRPSPSVEPCTDTPPTTAYWSYWDGNAGTNRWEYSNEGAMSATPRAGQVEGWSFGDGKPPSPAVAALIAPAGPAHQQGGVAGPNPTAAGDSAPSPQTPGGTQLPPKSSGAAAPGEPPPSAPANAPVSTGSSRPSAASSAPEPAAAASETAGTSGFPMLPVVAFGAIWLLGVLAAVLVRRRRRREAE